MLTLAASVVAALGLASLATSATSGDHTGIKGFADYVGLHAGHSHGHDHGAAVLAAADEGTRNAVTATAAATPRADCGPGSHPEAGAQGRVPLADYTSGRAEHPYTCNTELTARFGTTGGFQVHRYIDSAGRECAYYDSTLLFGRDLERGVESGVYALDMSEPSRPQRTAVLRSPAGQSPHESLRLNAARGLLAMNMGTAATYPGFVDIYDVSADCRSPVLRSSLPLAIGGHEGGFSPDGKTYWATTTAAPGVYAVDLTDPAAPQVVWRTTDYAVHGMGISADGTRAYLALVEDFVTTTTSGAGGLVILDVSEVQSRAPNPSVREISRLTWPEVSIPQNNLPVTIGGRRYVVQFDEFDSNVFGNDPADLVGGVHIIDIDDETRPRIVSRIRLEVHQQEQRATDQQDDPGNQSSGQGYAAHYCAVPREVEPHLLACSMIVSGLRVFDMRDPLRPREVAYFNQAQVSGPDPSERGAYAMSAPAFVPDRGEIWYSDSNTGFFNVRLTNGVAQLLLDPPVVRSATPVARAPDAAGAAPQPSPRPAPQPERGGGLPATGGGAPVAGAYCLVAILLRRIARLGAGRSSPTPPSLI